jgi:hypothetical protein
MGYWTERAAEHLCAAANAVVESARLRDVDETQARDWLNTSIDERLLAEACARNAVLYEGPDRRGEGATRSDSDEVR